MARKLQKDFDQLPPYVLKKQMRDLEKQKRKNEEEEKQLEIQKAEEAQRLAEALRAQTQAEMDSPMRHTEEEPAANLGVQPNDKTIKFTKRLRRLRNVAKHRLQDTLTQADDLGDKDQMTPLQISAPKLKVVDPIAFSPEIQKQIQASIKKNEKDHCTKARNRF